MEVTKLLLNLPLNLKTIELLDITILAYCLPRRKTLLPCKIVTANAVVLFFIIITKAIFLFFKFNIIKFTRRLQGNIF